MKQRPTEILGHVPHTRIAKAIGLDAALLGANGWESRVVKTEVSHLIVPVKDTGVLTQGIPNKVLLKALSEEYGFDGFYLFSTEPSTKGYLASARFFNPGIGIDEDPAIGTAAGPLTGYLEKLGYVQKTKAILYFRVNKPGILQKYMFGLRMMALWLAVLR